VLDDLEAAGYRFGDPLIGLTVDEVAAGLETQAAWHASTWNERRLESVSWLGQVSPTVVDFYAACLTPAQWQASTARLTEQQLPTNLRDRRRLEAALRATQEMNARGPRVLAHGDTHLGNTYIDADGRVAFLDWQTLSRGCWGDDVAYFIVGALTSEDRRASEWDLLDHYRDAMTARGVRPEQLGDVRDKYRRQHLHGLFWGLMPEGYQPQDRCEVMCQRFAEAMLEQATLDALGV
jgi:thiamine kinase-like enzyme